MAGTVISSAAVNSDLSDIATALTGSFARDGQSTMLGQFKALDGSLLAPGYSFANEVTTGLTRPAAGQIGVVIQGAQIVTVDATGIINTTLVSPVLSGVPTTPTAAPLTNNTQVASTAYVDAAVLLQTFASGTVLLFWQTAAPTGWTKITTQNDKALRVVSGSGGVSGGTNAFSTVMAQTVVGSSTLSTAQLASHAHSYTAPGATIAVNQVCGANVGAGSGAGSTTGANGSGTSHNHTITMSIQFIDIILCSKN